MMEHCNYWWLVIPVRPLDSYLSGKDMRHRSLLAGLSEAGIRGLKQIMEPLRALAREPRVVAVEFFPDQIAWSPVPAVDVQIEAGVGKSQVFESGETDVNGQPVCGAVLTPAQWDRVCSRFSGPFGWIYRLNVEEPLRLESSPRASFRLRAWMSRNGPLWERWISPGFDLDEVVASVEEARWIEQAA